MENRLLQDQSDWLDQYQPGLRISEQGRVISIGDGITWIEGLSSAAMDEVLLFEDGSHAMVCDLNEKSIGAVLLHETDALTSGTAVHGTGRALEIPVGDGLLGRIVDPLGLPLDDGPPLGLTHRQALESPSPPITARDFVNTPLYTGIKIIDTIIPIGKGQRQLLVGDEGLGRSSIALDTVINQRERDMRCVYVLIGQKRSAVVSTIDILRRHNALEYTTVVVAEASSLPGLQHLAPFAGCAVAEFWMQKGRDVLVVYDDLSTHAKSYRELSLLLRRPPGREAYPGDIFSVHSRLLERATCLNASHGGGSMTALPIVETKLGEIAAYIPTNLISITDGQIYLDHSLFAGGSRPAIDITRSVSRIGGKAQHAGIKKEAGHMKLDYLQFLELEVFTRFGARLEKSKEATIHRGRLLREILKQDRYTPLPETFQMAWMVAFNDGLFDTAKPTDIAGILKELARYVRQASLDLDTSREVWSSSLAEWFSRLEKDGRQ